MDNTSNLPQDRMLLIQEEPRGPSYLIEIPVAAGTGSTVNLPIITQLQSDTAKIVVIKSIRLVTVTELANSPTLGNANAPLTELQKISLLLYAEGWEKGYYIPLLSLNNTFTEGSGIPFRDRTTKLSNWTGVDWNKSKLIWSNGTPAVGTPYAVLLEVEYERYDVNGQIIRGPFS